jgi:hypothetical protein
MFTYQFHARMLTLRRLYLTAASKILIGAVGVVLLSWLVFSLLLSTWHLTDPSLGGHLLWNASSVVILSLAAIYVTRELLRLADIGVRPLSRSGPNYGGLSPGAPLTGAPCPVPVRPTPHLTRSAAERLPLQKRQSLDAISREDQ